MVSQVPTPSIYEAQINALGQFLQTLREAPSNVERVSATVDYLQQEVQPSLIWIGLYDADGRNVSYLGGWLPDAEANLLSKTLPIRPSDPLDQVFIHQKPIGVADLSQETHSPDLLDLALKFAIQGCGLFPLRNGTECRGVVIVGWPHQNLSLSAEQMSCFAIAFKDLGTRLDRAFATGQLLSYRGADSFVGMLDKVCLSPTLESAIETIALEIQSRLKPIETRIFWFAAQHHAFFLAGSAALNVSPQKHKTLPHISSTTLGKLYAELQSGKPITLLQGTPNAKIAEQISSQVPFQSVQICPIIAPEQLVGFITISLDRVDAVPDVAQAFLKTSANLLALASSQLPSSPLLGLHPDQQGDILQRCLHLLCQADQGIEELKQFAFQLCQALQAKHFSLIYLDPAARTFGVAYQLTAQRRQLLPNRLEGLNDLDWEFLSQAAPTFQLEHWAEDLRLLTWRNHFAEIGVQSLLSGRLRWNDALEGLLFIGHDTPRFWTPQEQQWLASLAEPLGYLVHQWRTRHQQDEWQQLSQGTLTAITGLQSAQTLEAFNQTLIQGVAQVFSPSMATLITWHPGEPTGELAAVYPESLPNPLAIGQRVILEEIPLLSDLLQQQEPIPLSKADLPIEIKTWPVLNQVDYSVAIALRPSPMQSAIGVLWVGRASSHTWTPEHSNALQTLVRAAAAIRYHHLALVRITTQTHQAEQINWYKSQKIERFHQELSSQIQWLEQQDGIMAQAAEQSSTPLMFKRRYQALVQSLQGIKTGMTQLSQTGMRQLRSERGMILLPSFLKSALERLEPLGRQHQLWTQVHGLPDDSPAPGHQISIQGDIEKFKLILDDLLVAACQRSFPSGRIDLWPRLLDVQWLELSITDQGVLDPAIVYELSVGRVDPIAPSKLDQQPGQQLWLCQQLMQKLGGELGIYNLDDGRILTRLVYPVAAIT